MTVDSPSPPSPPSPPRLPPAPPQARPAASAPAASAAAAADASGDEPDDLTLTPSLIGDGPGQYLLEWENRQSFDEMKAAFEQELRPVDPIERMWTDEFVDLEWDLHRLRRTRRTVVERALVERLTKKTLAAVTEAASLPARPPIAREELTEEERYTFNEEEPHRFEDDELPELVGIKYQALKCVRGDRHGHEFMLHWLVRLDMDDEVRAAQADSVELLARVEYSIHATSRLRDAVVDRLYSRRVFKERRSVASGEAR